MSEERNSNARVLTDPPAPWFAEIYPGGDGRGWMEKRARYAMVHAERSRDVLVVAFDNIGPVNDLSFGREPWAWKFIQERGHSYLGVMARKKVWYRDPEIIGWLQGLAKAGFFARFGRVVLCGTSMGGFASLAFAPLVPGCTSIAFNPQSTLHPEIATWEERWGFGRAADWTLPYGDAAEGVRVAGRAYLLYDPYFEGDRLHADRITGENVVRMKLWGANHFIPVFLRKVDLLKTVMGEAIDGTLTEARWYALARRRRQLPWYAKALEARARERGHDRLAERITPVFRAQRMALKARERRVARRAARQSEDA